MTIALVAHISNFSGNANSVTTTGITTTGSSLIVVGVNWYASSSPGTLTDSNSNTWTPLAVQSGANPNSQMYYCASPIVGTGHTFMYAGTSLYCDIFVTAWSGTATSSPFDVQSVGAVSGTTVQPGSVTPSANNSLIITNVATSNSAASATINSGFTISDQIAGGGGNWFGGMAYLIQTTAAAVNPTWTMNASTTGGAEIAVFKAATGGGGGGTVNNKWFSISGL